ncbi:hypothetical protein R1flu_022245 [Riccia fluitans]|uniref:Uncharacterized protein n=1 Tax=Riccia fluitans TaxID=41844 RepID=A0ABD1ZSA2_9MARC
MALRRSKNLKTKEVKIPHLTISNRKKMETWGLGSLFAVDWNGTYDNLVEELIIKPKAAGPKFEHRGKPEEWTSEILNAIFAPVRPEHFQHNLLAFYHHAWAAITNSDAPTPNWGEVVKKIVARQIKSLGVCNEVTCLGPYLTHLYSHFQEMDTVEKEASKKRKASIQTIFDSDTKTEPEEEKEPPKEVPRVFSEVVARNLKEMFAPPPIVETDLQPWKEMVITLIDLLTEEQKKIKLVVEQQDYFEDRQGQGS